MSDTCMGFIYLDLETLCVELEDSVSFMETFKELEDEETKKRKEDKILIVKQTKETLKKLKEEYKEKLENGESDDSYRICSKCDDIMVSGFVIDGGMYYYCSSECLHQDFSQEEYEELYDDGEGDSYWTHWY